MAVMLDLMRRFVVCKYTLVALIVLGAFTFASPRSALAGTSPRIAVCWQMNWGPPMTPPTAIYCGTRDAASRAYLADVVAYNQTRGYPSNTYTYTYLDSYLGSPYQTLNIHWLRNTGHSEYDALMPYCTPGWMLTPNGCAPDGNASPTKYSDAAPACTIVKVGNPCDASSGNKSQTEIDYNGPGINFVRTYNSIATDEAQFRFALGANWRGGFDSSISFNTDDYQTTAVMKRPDGKIAYLTLTSGQWVAASDVTARFEQIATGWKFTLRDGTVETYDTAGKLQTITDRVGQTQTLSYDTSGKLTSVTGPFGHTVQFAYGANGRMSSLTAPGGGVISYTYDSNNNLTRVTYPDGTAKLYHYENATFPYHLTGISYDNGSGVVMRYSTYAYDTTGRAASTEHATTDNGSPQERFTLAYNSDTQTTVTGPTGIQEVMTFQINLGIKNLVSKQNLADGKTLTQVFDGNNLLTSRTDEANRTTTDTYNTANQRTSMTEAAGTTDARTTTYQYVSTTLDLPTLVEGPSVYSGSGAKKRTTIAYDGGNRPTSITQSGYTPTGTVVSRTIALQYNSFGQIISIDGPRTDVADVTSVTYNNCTIGGACGQVASVTNAVGHATTFSAYDAHGRVTQMTDANGLTTSYAYDTRGRVTTVTQTPPTGASRVTRYSYNDAGDVTSATMPDGMVLTYAYDAAHYLRSVTDNLGNKVEYTYDLRGNRTKDLTKDPNGTLVRSVETAYDIRNRVASINVGGSITQVVYNAVGNLTRTTDPNNNPSTTHAYDTLGRLLQTVDALSGNTAHAYDVNDRLKQVTAPNGAATKYVYDDLGNQLQEVSPDRGTITSTYDAAGNVTAQTNARGVTASYAHDALGRLRAVDYPGTAEDVTFTYDVGPSCVFGIGRLCAVVDGSGTTAYAYDPFGNITQQTHTESGVNYVTTYTYDAGDRLVSMTYPDGRVVSYTRDAIGRIMGISATVNGTSTVLVSNRAYSADGLMTSQALGNRLTETRSYDLQGRLTQQSVGSETRTYQYDANGNLTFKAAFTGSGAYTYDALDRLTQENLTSLSNTFTYDANGNRLTDSAQSYSYGTATNRLVQVGASTVTLDAAGNTVSDQNGGRTFTYNSAGQVYQVRVGGKLNGTYTYNAQGLRTRKVTSSATTVYHYDLEGRLLMEATTAGPQIRTYVWAEEMPIAAIDWVVVRRVPTEVLTYLHTDHLNTPRLATNTSGVVVWRWEGRAFGNTTPNEDPDGNQELTTVHLRFPGQYYDAETGLHYNWNRYYDPSTGRYITSDPIGLAGGPNTYSYVRNNSLRYVDPLGLAPNPAELACFGGPNPLCVGGVLTDIATTILGGATIGAMLSTSGDSAIDRTRADERAASEDTTCQRSDDDKCEKQAQVDEAICRSLSDLGARSRCWASANERYGACRAGRHLPPLVTR